MSKRSNPSRTAPITPAQAAILEASRLGQPLDFKAPVPGGPANVLLALARRGLIDPEGGITQEGWNALIRYQLRKGLSSSEDKGGVNAKS